MEDNMSQEKKITMTGKQLEKEIIAFLNKMSTKPGGKKKKFGCTLKHGSACALGTCVDNKPRVTPVDFFNDGMTIWIAGEPGGKIANIMRNPRVAIGIYESVDHTVTQKSLQLWGRAQLINHKNNPKEFQKRLKALGIKDAAMGMMNMLVRNRMIPKGQEKAVSETIFKRFNFIKITPEKAILLHMDKYNPPLKKIWGKGKATVKVAGL
jgi:nitroimidazol reductase NimA-like FMN-containing flavoprotein (pyridoxamine 5'-phosphate oxidase superfamily)